MGAFSGCTGLKTIEIPASVSDIAVLEFFGEKITPFDYCSEDLCFITLAGSYAEQWALDNGFQVKNK